MVRPPKQETVYVAYAEDFEQQSSIGTILSFTYDPVWYTFIVFASFLDNLLMIHYILLRQYIHTNLFPDDSELDEKIEVIHLTYTVLYLIDIFCSAWTQHIKKSNIRLANPTIRPIWILGMELVSVVSIPLYTKNAVLVRFLLVLRTLKEVRIYYHFRKMRSFLIPKVSTCIIEYIYYVIMLNYVTLSLLSTYYCIFHSMCELNPSTYTDMLSLSSCIISGDRFIYRSTKSMSDYLLLRFKVGQCISVIAKFVIDYKLQSYIIFTYICIYREKYSWVNLINFFKRYIVKTLGLKQNTTRTILKYFDVRWQYRSMNLEYIPKCIPYNWSLELSMDYSIYAFRHSHIFRNRDIDFLRHVSTFMKRTIHLEGEYIYQRGVLKDKMVYIASGSINLLSSLNEGSTLMTLTEGSCLGESTLLFPYVSLYSFRCKTNVVLYTLNRNDFAVISRDYPFITRDISQSLLSRYNNAKVMSNLKQVESSTNAVDLIYLKKSLHRLMSTNEKLTNSHMIQNINIAFGINKINYNESIFTKQYLDSLVIEGRTGSVIDVVYIKSKCCWILRPNSPVLLIWEHLIAITYMICALIIPYYCAVKQTQSCLFALHFVNFVWFIDLILLIITPVSDTSDVKKNSEVILERLSTVNFYLDFFAAFPIDILKSIVPKMMYYNSRYLMCFRLLKLYRVLKFLRHWENKYNVNFLAIEIFKYTCYYFILLYYLWCFGHNWASENELHFVWNYFTYSGYILHPRSEKADLASIFVIMLFSFFEFAAIPTLVSSYILQNYEFTAKSTVIHIMYTFAKQNVRNKFVLNRLTAFIKTQISANEGNLILRNCDSCFNLPPLYKQMIAKDIEFKVLTNIKMFHDVPDKILEKIACICTVRVFHTHMHLVTHGIRYEDIYFLMSGEASTYIAGQVFKTEIGSPLNLLELNCDMQSAINVVTTTDVIILAFNYKQFLRIVKNHHEECKFLLNTLSTDSSTRTALLEISKSNKKVSEFRPKYYSFYAYPKHIKYSEYLKYDYIRPFQRLHRWSFIQHFLMKVTIIPNGKFIFYWELSRCIIIYISCLTYVTIPLAYCTFDSRYCIIPLVPYVASFIDIYIRLHICYYDENGILITHPLKTAKYYFKHAFFVDLFATIPLFLITLLVLKNPAYSCFMGCLQLYRLIGFRATLKKSVVIGIVYLILWLILIMLFLACIVYIVDCSLTEFEYPYRYNCSLLVPKGDEEFLFYLFLVTSTVTGSGVKIDNGGKPFNAMYIVYFLSAISVFGKIFGTCYIFRICYSTNKRLRAYRRKTAKIIKLLRVNRCSPYLQKEVIHHYDFYWQWIGINPFHLYRNLNVSLRMDLLYHLYGESLRAYTTLGSNTPRLVSFFKHLLIEMTPVPMCTNAYIITINDIESSIYFVYSGSVDAIGPDGTTLCSLKQGSIFGNLQNVDRARQKVSIISNTPTKLLFLKTTIFYKILKDYPDVKHKFDLSKINSPYFIQSKVPENLYSPPPNTPAYFKQVKLYNIFQYFRIFHVVTCCHIGLLLECFHIGTSLMSSAILTFLYIFDTVHVAHEILKYFVGYLDYNENKLVYDKIKVKRRLNSIKYLSITIITCLPLDLLLISTLPHDYKFISTIFRINRFLRIFYAVQLFRTTLNRYAISKGCNIFFNLYLLSYHLTIVVFGLTMFSSIVKYLKLNDDDQIIKFAEELIFVTNSIVAPTETKVLPKYIKIDIVLYVIVFIYKMLIFCHIYHIIHFHVSVWEYRRKEVNEAINYKQCIKSRTIKRIWTKQLEEQFEIFFKRSTGLFQMSYVRYLKSAVHYSLYGYLFKRHPVFGNTHIDFQRQLIEYASLTIYPNRFVIIAKNDIRSSIYFVHRGSVIVYTENEHDFPVRINQLYQGDSFGIAQGLDHNIKYDFNYMAMENCQIIELQLEHWEYLLDFFPASKETIYAAVDLFKGADSCRPPVYPKKMKRSVML